jgi:type I restriction enzyme S subunit
LLTKVGTTGIAVTVDVETEFSIFVSLALLKFSKSNLNRFYLRHLINSPFVRRQSADNTQGVGNKNLVLRLINQFVVPIPPLAEQQRILAKIEELMVLCDRLEVELVKTQAEGSRFLESVLNQALYSSVENLPALAPAL